MKLFNLQKKNKNNFEEANLPSTRKAQFKDVVKLNYRTLVFVGLMLLVFSLPIFLCVLYRDSAQINLIEKYEETEELTNQLIFNNLLFSWLLLPTVMIFSLGLAGSLKIIRRLIWGEPVFLKEDFIIGIKQNWKGFIVVGLFGAVLNAINALVVSFLPGNNFLTYLPMIALIVLFYPVIFVFAFYNVIYSDKVIKNLVNSLKLYFRSVFVTFLLCLICYVLLLVKFIPSVLRYIISAVIIVFVLPIFLVLFYEYEVHVFDKYINIYQYPQFYRKGLYTKPIDENQNNKENIE